MSVNPRITSTAAFSFDRGVTATDLKEFVGAIPEEASISVTVNRGDPRDPRESGMISTTITATWNGSPK